MRDESTVGLLPSTSSPSSSFSSSSSSSFSITGSSGGGHGHASARLERRSWFTALAIFTGVVIITSSAPYYLPVPSFLAHHHQEASSSSSSSTNGAAATGAQLLASNAANLTWEGELRQALGLKECHKPESIGYHPDPKIPWTVFTSFPRSGNTHLRNLVEQSSGYYTSSIECDDPDLEKYFPGECNKDNRFLLKAHFPVFQHNPLEETSAEYLNWWRTFDKVLWVQRNPFDAIFSLWNMMEMLESFQRGDNLHEARVELPGGKLSWDNEKHRTKVFHLIYMYQQHYYYWRKVPLPTLHVRYEDLLGEASLPTLMTILQFLLPMGERPALWRMICADETSTAYHGKTSGPLYAYSKFDKRLQDHILAELAQPWCTAGYDKLMFDTLGLRPVNCHDVPIITK